MRRGFTLIELLILLALTALLMSMLAPSLAKSRDKAIGIECLSNLKQIVLRHHANRSLDSNARWGDSIYDLGDDGINPAGHGGPGFDTDTGDPDSADGTPRSDDGNYGRGGYVGELGGFDERMETTATVQPKDWSLPCPVGYKDNENSYGMLYRSRFMPIELVSTSRDIIFGCSDYKIIDVVGNFDFRHQQRASIVFGDLHMKAMSFTDFSLSDQSETSDREEPTPFDE